MLNNKTFTLLHRIISLVLVLAMLLSGIAQSGFRFGQKTVLAQSDSPSITTSISTGINSLDQDEESYPVFDSGETGVAETEPPVSFPIETEAPVVTEPVKTGTPIISPIETATPVVTDPVITTPEPSPTPTTPVLETPDPTSEPEPSITPTTPVLETPDPTSEPEPSPTPTTPIFETQVPTSEPEPRATDGIFNWIDITIDGIVGVEITAYLGTDTVLAIPATLGDHALPVLSIGAHALQGKGLTFITLPEGLINIGDYAFTDNQLASITTPEPPQHIILPSTLKYIGEFAFRDNSLTVLDIPASVLSLGKGAFISNNLNSLTFHEGLQSIGNSAFELNTLVEVWMPNSITTMGTDVFALNNRYVKIVTDNPLIQTEYSPKGFGHVVNPITIVVKHHDPDGNMLISDKILGADLSIPGEAFSVGVPVTYTPEEIAGYSTESPITFTPDCDGYVVILTYHPTNNLPVITKTPIMIPPNATAEQIEVLLQEGLTATDYQGNDITDDVTWTHNIDSAVSGAYTVKYSVTDQWGNKAVKQVEALVGTDWYQYPTCNGWVLGDFTYDETGTILTGFSEQGEEKNNNGNYELCLPGFSPTTLENITEIGAHAFNHHFEAVDFSRVTELVRINEDAFGGGSLTALDLSHNPKLDYIGDYAFFYSPFTTLNLSQNTALTYIGYMAFSNHNLETIDLSQLSALTYLGENSFTGYSNSSPESNLILPNTCNLRMIDNGAFSYMRFGSLDFSNCTQLNHIGVSAFMMSTASSIHFAPNSAITYIGESAFLEAPINTLDLGTLPNLEYIGGGAFSNSKMTELDFRKTPKLTYIGEAAFYNNSNLIRIDFSESAALTQIGGSAFDKAKLTSLDFSGAPNLINIGSSAFASSPLQSLILPVSIQEIDSFAFADHMLTHLDLSNATSLKVIGTRTFQGSYQNENFTSINFGDQCAITYIGYYAFEKAKFSQLDLSVCKNLSFIGPSAFESSPLQTLQLDNSALSFIGERAFFNATLDNLDLAEIPNVVVIDSEAFRKVTASSLNFSQNTALQYIGKGAFYDATLSYLDLSNSPHLKYLGSQAFKSSTLEEIWISPEANFAVPEYNGNNTQLYTGLFNGDTAVFRTHSGSAVLPPDPTGSINISGKANYVYAINYLFYIGPYTMSETTDAWPWSQQIINPAYSSDEGSSAYSENKSFSSQGGKYIVNPKEITVYSVDENGNTLVDPYIIKTPGGNTYTVYPRPIFGYCSPKPVVVDLTVENPSVTFIYGNYNNCKPDDTTNILLSQSYNTPIKPGPYLIGNKMISRVKLAISGFNGSIQAPKIVLFYDPSVYDESAIFIPVTPGGSVIDYTAENGMLTINLNSISGGFDLEIPITWRFKKYVTPEFTPFPIDAYFLTDGGHPWAQANPVDFQGYYPDPYINKYANGSNQDGVVLREFTPSRYGDPAIDDVETEYVIFTFSVKNLERNVGTYTITDTLPVYPSMENGVESERTAIFDAAVNPGWVLSEDGKTVTYTGNATNSRNTPIPRLRLRFPWAMYYYNIQNTVSGVLTPFDKSIFEDDMLVGDDIVFSFGEKLEPPEIGNVAFNKSITRPHYNAGKAYFYDNDYDRHLDMPWDLMANSRIDLYDVVLSDFNLDPRLYYSSAVVPEAFIGGTYHLMDETGISIVTGEITAAKISWGQDAGLLTKRVEFHIDHLQAGFYIATLNTRLVNPDIPHFDETPGSSSNVFMNTGALSYATAPGTEPLSLEDTEPLYVVKVDMQVAPVKIQTLSRTPSVPGDPVKYEIYVNDRSQGTFHDPLNDFVMIDLLPNGIQVSSVVLSDQFLECEGSYQYVSNYNNTGRAALVFSSASLLNPGVEYNRIATIHAVVDPTATEGDYLNEVFMDFSNTEFVTNIGEQVWPQLNDPNDPPNTYSRATTQLEILSIKEVRSYKAIRISDAHPWSYTGIETPAGSEFEYSLNVFNYTDKPRTNVVLVDVFPYINDTAITENLNGERLPRGSEFANSFDYNRPVTVNLPGYSVQYYNSDTPIVYGSATTEEVLDGLAWTTTPAANTIAIRIVQGAGVELDTNTLLQVIVPMKAPANDDLSLSGLEAYNTFVRKDDSTAFGGENRYLEPNRVYNRIPMPKVDIILTKVGENPEEYLQGAVFELRNSDGVLVKRGTTNVNGVINFRDIEIGNYTLSEVQAPTGYKLLPNPIIITEQEMLDAFNASIALAIGPIHNTPKDPPPILGSIIIEKLDANHAPLVNFEFTIEGITPANPPEQPGNTHIRMSGRSGSDGRITFSGLPLGAYRITETRPMAPFLPVAPFTAEITFAGQVVKFTLDNDPPNPIINDKVGLRVTKLGVLSDSECASNPLLCNNMSGTPLPGAQFSVFAADGTTLVDGPLTTNADGYVNFPSEGHPGLDVNTRYILREVAGVEGYTPYTEDIPFMINERGKLFFCESDTSCTTPFEHRQIYVPNIRIPQTGRVTVTKVDNAVPKGNGLAGVLEGAEFTIYRQLDSGEWEVVEVITSGADGLAVSSELPAGVYKIKETKAPIGYALSPLEETFVINPFPLPGEPLLLEFYYVFVNVRLDIALIKYEMLHRNVTYAEAVDLLTAMGESCPSCKIVTTDFVDVSDPIPADTIVHIIKPLDMVGFELLDENHNPLVPPVTGTTDANGWLVFSYDQIDQTKIYYLRELTTPVGYRPVEDIRVRIADYVSRPGFNGRIVVPVENKLKLGQISLSKYTEPALQGLAGIEFTLTYPDGVTTSVKTTDANGYIVWPNLTFGTYTLKETKTLPGYVPDDTTYTIVVTNDTPHKYIVIYNKTQRDIRVVKVDRDTLEFIPGAKFALYTTKNDLGSLVMESVTDPVTGNEMFYNILYGEYWLKEIKSPPGYRMNEEWQQVVIDETQDLIISFTVKDSPIEEYLPDTGTLGALGYFMAGVALLAAGFWFSRRWAKTQH